MKIIKNYLVYQLAFQENMEIRKKNNFKVKKKTLKKIP